jgi:catechol 2,3-dioxygenase-like lactoylglutathione lyase family enzyme
VRVVAIKISQRRQQAMIRLNVTSVMVLDQDEALDFYVNKLGLELGKDIKQGPFRWLTVRVPGDPDIEIFLEEPGPPLHDDATAAQLRELITKGAMSSLVFQTDDVRGLYETLQARGVTDFTQEPSDNFYGIDMGLRDPFGNAIRILQSAKVARKAKA